jgi:tRNA A58 N-methylase Trm61
VLFEDPHQLVVYPNPVPGSGTITVYLSNAVRSQVKVIIHDMTGRQVYNAIKNGNNQNRFEINPQLSPGIYTMRIIGKNLDAIEKIVVAGK